MIETTRKDDPKNADGIKLNEGKKDSEELKESKKPKVEATKSKEADSKEIKESKEVKEEADESKEVKEAADEPQSVDCDTFTFNHDELKAGTVETLGAAFCSMLAPFGSKQVQNLSCQNLRRCFPLFNFLENDDLDQDIVAWTNYSNYSCGYGDPFVQTTNTILNNY